jgi:hypothetical protein
MTLRTNGLFCLNMTAPTCGSMTLSSSNADCLNISAYLLRRGFDLAVAFIATCLLCMRPVLKIIEAQCRSRTPCILQRKLCIGVADPAFTKLLTRLMNVAAVALLMIRKTRCRALSRRMTSAAFWCFCLTGHFLGIHMLLVREPLYTKLTHLCRKTYPGSLSINRRFVTYDAHLARGICKVPSVTLNASRMTRKHWRDIVVRALVTETAVLRLGLVLGSSMIERRRALDYRGLFYVKGRWRGRRFWRGLWCFRSLVGRWRGSAATSHCGEESKRRRCDDCES